MLKANESGSQEAFDESLKAVYFRCLENDYVKLVKKLSRICEAQEEVIDFNDSTAQPGKANYSEFLSDFSATENEEIDFDAIPTEEAEPDLC